MPETVSVIIPCHQHGATLPDAVRSALAQTHPPAQIVIVNDGSTDSTADVAESLRARHPACLTVIHQPNQGQARAREAGLRAATGRHFVMLDADDLLDPDMFRLSLAAFAADPHADATAGDAHMVAEDGTTILKTCRQDRVPGWPQALEWNPFGALVAMMVKTEVARRLGGLAVDGTPGCEDWDLWTRMIRAGRSIRPLGRVVGRYRRSPASYSMRAPAMLRAKIELLDRCTRDDPRLQGVAPSPQPAISVPQYERLRNGIVFYSLGLTVAGASVATQAAPILELLVPGTLDPAYCLEQFRWGLQYGLEIAAPPEETRLRGAEEAIARLAERFHQTGHQERADQFRRDLRAIARAPFPSRWSLTRLRRLFRKITSNR